MNVFKWALAGIAGVSLAGFLAITALGSGVLQAEEPGGGAGEGRRAAFAQALADRLGITVEELKEAREGALDDVLAEAVADGRLTQEQADRIKDHPLRAAHGLLHRGARAIANVFGAAAETLGMTTEELRTELKEGKSLAEIAGEEGVSTADLKSGITNEIEAQIEKAVAEGKLSQERADTILANLSERLDEVIEREGTGKQRP